MKKSYTININLSVPVKRFWTIIVPALLLSAIIGLSLGIVAVDNLVIPNLPGMSPRGSVIVPSVVTLQYEKARESMYAVGLRLDVDRKVYSTKAEAGSIISQDPAAGEQVKKGRHIQVVISKGGEIGVVPDIIGETERNGRSMLLKSGFDNITIHRIYSKQWAKDKIFECSPAPGLKSSREIPITFTVSRGEEPTYVDVPDCSGLMLSDATAKLTEAGLVVGYIDHKRGAGRTGEVVSQSVGGGTQALPKTTVNLTVGAE